MISSISSHLKGRGDMSKKHARIFLALMTAVCLVGAWWVPRSFHIPEDAPCYAYRETHDGHWHLHVSDLSTSQIDTLRALLHEVELRQTLLPEGYRVSETVYDCIVSSQFAPVHETRFRLFRLNGSILGYADCGNRSYRILDPEPLYDFLAHTLSYA